MLDYARLREDTISQTLATAKRLAPDGKLNGKEWDALCPSRPDSKLGSFKINVESGMWSDFSTGEKGGDIISYCKYCRGYGSMAEAAAEVIDILGIVAPVAHIQKTEKYIPTTPIPSGVSPAPTAHPKRGVPSAVYQYKNSNKELMHYVYRFDTGDGKDLLPLTYCKNGSDEYSWQWKSISNNRPLYNLQTFTDKPVLIVEGEKAADAAYSQLGSSYDITTWSGGSSAVLKTDWKPLENKTIFIWPDADEVGHKAAVQIKAIIKHAQIVNLPGDLEKGWDLADNKGKFTTEELITIINAAEVPDAPFKCLGYNSSGCTVSYYYLPRGTQRVIAFTASEHTQRNLLAIAPLDYYQDHFSVISNKRTIIDWNNVANSLIRMSERSGIYDPSTIRGRGAWFDFGKTVLHLGDRLIVDNKHTDIQKFNSQYIYEADTPTEPANYVEPLPVDEANKFLDLLEMIAWERKIHSRFMAGFCFLANICGALEWRPHIWLTGGSGSGKTWIFDRIIKPILGAGTILAQSNSSEAGLRQLIGSDAFPVVFDEAETEKSHDKARMQMIIELARQASSESSAAIIKGTKGGSAVQFRVRSMFLFASINPIITQYADETRITICKLGRHAPSEREEKFNTLNKATSQLLSTEWCARMRVRAIQMIPTIRTNANIFSKFTAQETGSQRHGDQFGALMAGAYALQSDNLVEEDMAKKLVQHQDWNEQKAITDEPDENKCIKILFQHIVKIDQRNESIGEIIQEIIEDCNFGNTTGTKLLKRHGIKFIREKDSRKLKIAIADRHTMLNQIFKDTQWIGGWKHVLARIEGAKTQTVRFGDGMVTTATIIPMEKLFDVENLST